MGLEIQGVYAVLDGRFVAEGIHRVAERVCYFWEGIVTLIFEFDGVLEVSECHALALFLTVGQWDGTYKKQIGRIDAESF